QSFYVFICFNLLSLGLFAQGTITYGGRGIKPYQVIASDQAKLKETPDTLKDDSAMDGTGMDYNWYNMGRLMRQATLGVNFNDMKEFVKMTPEKWIDEQLKVPSPNMLEKISVMRKEEREYVTSLGYDFKDDTVHTRAEYFNLAWWRHNLENQDYLKQKLAYVYSQIFVISSMADVAQFAHGMASYYDILLKNTTGNFKDLLLGVSLHPSMGFYLSHFNNSKSIPERNIHPDENYAREIMQLFTIGLHQLNIDGSLKRDSLGNPIPTYTQKDIKELAKVFTGLSAGKAGGLKRNIPNYNPNFGESIWNTDFSVPMVLYEAWHEPGTKSFLNTTIPAGQKGMKDIEMAIEHIFRHPNVGPFIGKQLIQKLVTSNPSPAYIKKVAETFNDNGKGVRGDMAAVFKTILLHPEARSCESLQSPTQGKLQEPMVRLMERTRNYKLIPDANNKIFFDGGSSSWNFDQNILFAPTVFNFYLPTYSPLGALRSNNLLGPEFQMHNSYSSLRWANLAMSPDWLIGYYWKLRREGFYEIELSDLYPYANDPEALINQFDKRFTRGQLTLRTRRLMKYNMERNLNTKNRIHSSLGILLLSPEYNILK
ncbi:MAG: DUF1800 family protein, partial [Bacteroidetes bacterium]|nr:DUF1800 family protein [Bacteroidota bacterium]